MKVSICICHHKGGLIIKALDSLKKSVGVTFEILVGTSVKGAAFKDADRTIFIQGGPAHKRNMLFRYAQGEYIAFFDDDIEAHPTAVYEMVKVLDNDSKVGMVYGKLLNMEFPDRFDEAGSFLTWSGFLFARAESGCRDVGQFQNVEPILAGKSASCMIRRKVFSEIGMFDDSYEILGEETDLSWRVWLYGYSVLFVPSSITLHAFNTRFKPRDFYIPKRVYFNGCRNYITMLLTNLSYSELPIPIITQCVVWTTAAFFMMITRKFEAGAYIFKGLGYVITHMGNILRKRRVVQNKRKISDKELLKVVRKNPPFKYYINRFIRYIKTGLHG